MKPEQTAARHVNVRMLGGRGKGYRLMMLVMLPLASLAISRGSLFVYPSKYVGGKGGGPSLRSLLGL